MKRIILAVAVLLAPITFAQAPCSSVQPGAGWVCVAGGWLPPGHPSIPVLGPPPAPDSGFRVGRRYVRGSSDVYIAGAAVTLSGTPVLVAECVTVGEGCYYAGMGRLFLATATAAGWTEVAVWAN